MINLDYKGNTIILFKQIFYHFNNRSGIVIPKQYNTDSKKHYNENLNRTTNFKNFFVKTD